MNDSSLVITDKSFEKSRTLADIGVQIIEKPSRVVLQNVSVQCSVSQSSHSVQTEKVVTPSPTSAVNQSSDCCQSNNCCFHKFVETIACNSLKTFLKSLIELKEIPSEADKTLTNSESF